MRWTSRPVCRPGIYQVQETQDPPRVVLGANGAAPDSGLAETERSVLRPSIEPKNGWKLAEQAGDATPDAGAAPADSTTVGTLFQLRDDLRDYAEEHLCCYDGVVVVAEICQAFRGPEPDGSAAPTAARRGGSRPPSCQTSAMFLAYAGSQLGKGRCWTGSCNCRIWTDRPGTAAQGGYRIEDAAFRDQAVNSTTEPV